VRKCLDLSIEQCGFIPKIALLLKTKKLLMNNQRTIKNALISVFYKDNLAPIVETLDKLGITIYSTGGTLDFIEKIGVKAIPVETLTTYPSILGGRVKTLHPKIFGGILNRRNLKEDKEQLTQYEIPEIDLVIVDLYPFEETVKSGAPEPDIIEKIDIGGISLIRAAAKNFNDVVIISHRMQYNYLLNILNEQNGTTTLPQRKLFAAEAFNISSHYDTNIFKYLNTQEESDFFKHSVLESKILRYGENPHQKGVFFGKLDDLFEQLSGKELSYNNLLDVDAAVSLMHDFANEEPTFAILKHNNACGMACRNTLLEAWQHTLAGDPVSAFGGIVVSNKNIDVETATEIDKLFCEVIIAPGYNDKALEILRTKKNRIILLQKKLALSNIQFRSALNGVLQQEKDILTETEINLTHVTKNKPSKEEIEDLLFANKLVKHTKSNTIVLAKNKTLLASGTGQTSRVDALKQAIEKAKNFGFNLHGAVMASDAFFPFPDCVEIAGNAGISAVIQPGGSIKDKDSIEYCNQNNISMVFSGNRHFKH
jgi:phosphoribosylaminoimidazolecarboxamide formyltransferase/IMP cyclohydrolase